MEHRVHSLRLSSKYPLLLLNMSICQFKKIGYKELADAIYEQKVSFQDVQFNGKYFGLRYNHASNSHFIRGLNTLCTAE